VLDEMLDRARRGTSAVLVMRGKPGIGKTALLRYCARQASGFRVAEIAGVESELEMPYAALHQLCEPMLDRLNVLPEPQQQALRIAFGAATGSPPDRFVVGIAVLGLLAEVGAERPLVCLVDDAQWVDEPTRQVLGFVGRRLGAEPVLLVFAVREGGYEHLLPALPDVSIAGLPDEDARELLTAAVPGHLDDQVRDRIVAETRGNPLQLLELSRTLDPAELAGGFSELRTGRAPAAMDEHYVRRIRALAEPTRKLLLLAAADPTGDATRLWRAANSVGISSDAATAAETEQLLEIGSRVRFSHPLVRSAAYAVGTREDRNAAHRALAAATDVQDSDRRIWHLAAAATGPDEDLARELVQMAVSAQSRAGLAAAAAFLERAATLTPDSALRTDRALDAIEAHLQAGELSGARGLLARTAATATSDLHLARLEQLSGQLEAAATPGREAPVKLLQAAKRLETLDLRRAWDTYLQAYWAAILAGRFAAPGGDIRAVAAAVRAAPRTANPLPVDLILEGLAILEAGDRTAAGTPLRFGLDRVQADRAPAGDWVRWARTATTAAFVLWDVDAWQGLSARQVELARASGALTTLVTALNFQVGLTAIRGELAAAAELVAELDAVKEATDIQVAPFGAHMLAAYQGRRSADLMSHSAAGGELYERGNGYALQLAAWAAVVLYNGLGRYPEALATASALADEHIFLTPIALAELIEAATRMGHMDVAREAQQRLAPMIPADSSWAAGIAARSRALVSDGATAESCYIESIDCFARTPLRPDLGRSHLLYGEWLRRLGRPTDARQQLSTAYDIFNDMGAEAFAERARRELLATGARAPKRRSGDQARHELTTQEELIARLARDGRTNAEIGTELFLSMRTVEWHLRKVFAKLGITSRRELRDVLPPRTRFPATD
jgi:DNA-binding CsgD family transcriptional regulator